MAATTPARRSESGEGPIRTRVAHAKAELLGQAPFYGDRPARAAVPDERRQQEQQTSSIGLSRHRQPYPRRKEVFHIILDALTPA